MNVSVIGQVADVAGKILDAAKIRDERNNTPEMQENAVAEQRQILRDKIHAAVAAGDLEEIRKLAAEI